MKRWQAMKIVIVACMKKKLTFKEAISFLGILISRSKKAKKEVINYITETNI